MAKFYRWDHYGPPTAKSVRVKFKIGLDMDPIPIIVAGFIFEAFTYWVIFRGLKGWQKP